MTACDLLFRGGRVIDGSGDASRQVDVAVERDRIVDIGDCAGWRAEREIDAAGLVVAPGFIDCHTHDDLAVLETPRLACKLSQGVTTVIAGNCGISLAPLPAQAELPPPFPLLGAAAAYRYPTVEAYRNAFDKARPAVNLALLAGHSSLRVASMGRDLEREADAAAIGQMRDAVRLALRQGCIGLSTGLDYPPAAAASIDEVVALASVLNEFDAAVYATHMRDEGDAVLDAIEETLEIGRRAAAPVVISHLKCAGPANYGRSRDMLASIDAARASRQRVAFDVYPYTASSTALLPGFLRDADAVLVAESEPHPECNGRMLGDIIAEWRCSPEEACDRLYPATAIYFQMDEADLLRILSHPAAMIGSDGIPSMRRPHPRLWGSFPRVLGHYARERGLFALETAVHKMSGLTAARFAIRDRGLVQTGYYADLVLFDAARVIDRASFEDPQQASEGIVSVWVNGELAWQDGHEQRAGRGRFVTH